MRLIALTTYLLLFAQAVLAQTLKQNIEKAYTRFEQDEQFKYGISSLTVINAATGEVVFSKNGNVGLVPASTLKTVTAATALSVLGKDFTWTTTLGYSGKRSNQGELLGNLVITGGGDPTLGSSRYASTHKDIVLAKWVAAIRKAGIKSIKGCVLIDDRLFGTHNIPNGWLWEDIGNYYGASSGAISWDENQFKLIFKPASIVGERATLVYSDPIMPYLKVVNEVRTGAIGSGDNVYAYSAPYSNVIYVRGTYAADLKKAIGVSMPDPAFELAFRLQDTLTRLGITITQHANTIRRLAADGSTINLDSQVIIAKHQSPALAEVVREFNQKSINLYGESLIKTLALKQGKTATTSEGLQVVKNVWTTKLGIDANALKMQDGSGLSPATRVTTLSMAKILASARKESWFDTFYKSIPLNNDMVMKSGYIGGAIAYVGYQTTSAGIPFAFAFIVNNYNDGTAATRQKMFSVLDILKN